MVVGEPRHPVVQVEEILAAAVHEAPKAMKAVGGMPGEGTLFAIGILNAGFMGLVVVSLSTAYAFAEFFGLSGSLDDSFKKSKTFYILYMVQLAIALLVVLFPEVSFFQLEPLPVFH